MEMSRAILVPAVLILSGWTLVLSGSPSPGWKPYGLTGVTVTGFAATQGRLCAGTAGSGVVCMDLTTPSPGWEPRGLAGATISSLWVDPLFPNDMLAAIAPGGPMPGLVYRSTNAGASWQRADPGLSGVINAVSGMPL